MSWPPSVSQPRCLTQIYGRSDSRSGLSQPQRFTPWSVLAAAIHALVCPSRSDSRPGLSQAQRWTLQPVPAAAMDAIACPRRSDERHSLSCRNECRHDGPSRSDCRLPYPVLAAASLHFDLCPLRVVFPISTSQVTLPGVYRG